MNDSDTRFHEEWLGLAQPIEGLVFSIPVLADAQIAPRIRPTITAEFTAHLEPTDHGPAIRDTRAFFTTFLGYDQPGMIVDRNDLPETLAFYAPEGRQQIRPSFALAREPLTAAHDPFADPFADPAPEPTPATAPYLALVWDLGDDAGPHLAPGLDLDRPESSTGPWHYPPTAKLERLLRHTGVPIGFVCNRRALRLVYAPPLEATSHLTFRISDLADNAGRPLTAALELLFHARRTHGADPAFTFAGLLAESRRRQADVTEELARQVLEAVEILIHGFELAAARDCTGPHPDWLRAAMEEDGDHFYHGVLSVVLRLVFLLYAEDQGMVPVDHSLYARHLSVTGLYSDLADDAAAHPESMHHRFGAYGRLIALFRAVFLGVRHRDLVLPPRHGRLFDPSEYPFLEGGLPGWTAAITQPDARAAVRVPGVDDGTLYRVLHRLVILGGQRLSYATLGVEQLGSVYESLMGYHVLRLESPAVRPGKHGVWVELSRVAALSATERKRLWKDTCGLGPAAVSQLEKAVAGATGQPPADVLAEVLAALAPGPAAQRDRHRAEAGRLVLQPGEERRRTGSHYTPRQLTEKVVQRTLEPILACLGPAPRVEQILALKICDPAMGSGAFLVAACRALADQVVAAWTRSGDLARVAEHHGDAHLHARRLVAQRCLYGVDKNPAAVELAKLSLWLETMSKDLPFTFVDHALRHGDSLVGLDLQQIREFHWAPASQTEFFKDALEDALAQALEHRGDILALAEQDDAVSQREKERLLGYAEQAIRRVRVVADVCVGAFFAEAKDKARDRERLARLALVNRYLAGEDGVEAEVEALARDIRAQHAPFHWMLEFPEIFWQERPDPLQAMEVNGAAFVDAVVGNPPFGGKNNISAASGDRYIDWLKQVHPGAHGNSDLCAHFFRRSAVLLGQHGVLGLIATNTIAQGDTRTTGLKALVDRGWVLYDAVSSMAWEGNAAVTVAVVHAALGNPARHVDLRLDGQVVPAVNSRLRPRPERADPVPLAGNRGCAFVGSYVLGMGFTLTPEERDALVARDPRNGERMFPYLGGQEVNTSPTQDFERYVINFGQMSLAEAEQWPDLLAIVRDKVKPERDRLKNNADGLHRKKHWWQFGRYTPALFAALANKQRCMVTARASKHVIFHFQSAERVFSEQLVVFALDSFSHFAVLASRLHEAWAWLLSSTYPSKSAPDGIAGIRYGVSDSFETFPFPDPDPRTVLEAVESAGRALYERRAAFMVDTDQGLTATYNALKDPECTDPAIVELRRLHEAMDRAVVCAYGWDDLPVPSYCPATPAERAAVQAFEDEVIDRLYVLNAARAADESRAGVAKAKAGKARAKAGKAKAGGKAPPGAAGQGELF